MKAPEKNWLEWSCFALGLLLVTGVMGYLAFHALTSEKAPPKIELELGESEPHGDHFRVVVIARNRGDQTAESVQVEVVLKAQDKEERAELMFDHLPRQGRREGYVTFSTDPRTAEGVRARAVGYQTP